MKERAYLFYRAEDFSLYVFSLLIVAIGAWLAFTALWPRVLIVVALSYMAITFALKHGARADRTSFGAFAQGVLGYPSRFIEMFLPRQGGTRIGIFLGVLLVEAMWKQIVGPDTFLTSAFPAMAFWLGSFGAVTLFRTVVLIDHLRCAKRVQAVLEDSPWARGLNGLGIRNHIVHAYFTGVIGHICYFIPTLIFWRLLPPTYLREMLLFVRPCYFLFVAMREKGPSIITFYHAFVNIPTSRMITRAHEHDHQSRFHFTVFHGHHHDAIPSALIANVGAGFLETMERNLLFQVFLLPALYLPIAAFLMIIDMFGHQYIPGVFPYVKAVVTERVHHVAHHYGSLRPLGLGGDRVYDRDIALGYDPSNWRVRWFLDTARKYENIDESECARFVAIEPAAESAGTDRAAS